jgi:uncharacterized protein (DUF2345 family)
MTERPNQNIYKRQLISFNPNFRIDTANPQMGSSGTDVYRLYGITDDNNVSSVSLSSSGLYSIKNDRTIEIVAGEKNEGKGVDIIIVGRNGDVTITAERTGMVRIKANNIMLDADEDITLKAGRNIIQQSSSGRILLKGVSVDADGIRGNIIENMGIGFGMKVFSGSFVGADVLSSAFQVVSPFINKVL